MPAVQLDGKTQVNVFIRLEVRDMLDAIIANDQENGSTSRSQVIERLIIKEFRRRKLKLDSTLEQSRK